MLTALSIRNIVLIDRLDLSFPDGLSVLTGETGAGKSILLDALGLALGGRSESRYLRAGSERGSVAASFQMPQDHPILAELREHDLPADRTVIFRRVLSGDGRTRAYVNDEAVGVNLLRRLGGRLIEIQGQFDERGLMNPATHRGLLDAFGGYDDLEDAVRQAFDDWRNAARARLQAEEEAAKAKRDEEYLHHAKDELEALDPSPGEERKLAEDRALLQNAEAVADALNNAYAELDGESAAEARLRAALVRLDREADRAAGRLDPARKLLERAIAETQEAMRALRIAASELPADGGDLENIEERLFTLRETARKHGIDVDDLPIFRDRLSERLSLLDDQAGRLDALRVAEEEARDKYSGAARRLSNARQTSAVKLDKAVNAELSPLKLERAGFSTVIEPLPESDWGPQGVDRVSFLVTTNPGAEPGPLSQIASGGELSRFMLALKVVLAEVSSTPTLVFDEVDSGIGGATADAVGERLSRLARSVQVLVVTHSPQVAARGDTHLRVEKRDAGGLAVTHVDRLEEDARREEVARMLSGREITEEARAAASRLLEGERL